MERDSDNPLKAHFSLALQKAFDRELGLVDVTDVEDYLAAMLVRFVHLDQVYGIRDARGQRVEQIAEMVAEGDVRLRADSFEREREVHRHIGDFLLFWTGVFPEYLKAGPDALINPMKQGQVSYYVASTFDYPPYDQEAATFKKLSEGFEQYSYGLRIARTSLGFS